MHTSTEFLIRCAACGLFLCDVSNRAEVIAVTTRPENAMQLCDGTAAERLCSLVRAEYPSFDWRAVPRAEWSSKPARSVFITVDGQKC